MAGGTLVEQAQQHIKAMILNHEYDEKNFLPSEGELSERLSVSRVTVREAIRSLEVRGFVRRVHGKGILVCDNRVGAMTQVLSDMLSMNTDMLELIETRRILEVEAARLAAARAEEEDLAAMQRHLQIMESSRIMDDAYYTADLDFHVCVVRAAKNNLLYTLLHACTPLLKDLIVTSSQSEECIEQKFHYHRGVYDNIVRRDAEGAARVMSGHMQFNEKLYLANVKRLPSSGALPGPARPRKL